MSVGHAGVCLRGLAMGMAEAAPGVSGGTIALVTGIYDELVGTLAKLSPPSFGLLRRGLGEFWRHHNLTFLVALGAGMAVGLVAMAEFLVWLLSNRPSLAWSFLFGLMVVATCGVALQSKPLWLLALGVPGLAVGLVIASGSGLPEAAGSVRLWALFGGGALAATAWIVPGVSGAFVLVLLGLYAPVLAAVHERNLGDLAALAAGMVVGLMLMSRLLAHLLATRRHAVLGLVTGLMAGSLLKLWPWRSEGAVVMPTTAEPLLTATIAVAVLGAVAALALLAAGRKAERP